MGETTALSVHRCRFVDYTPSAITCLAFPPLPLPSIKGKRKANTSRRVPKVGMLAVGRANGNIELCEWTGSQQEIEAPQAWVVTKTLAGPSASKVDSIALTLRFPQSVDIDEVPATADLRLFSTGGGNELLEWDIAKGYVRRSLSSQGGSIWSIAANPASTLLALGCEDGSIHIINLEHDSFDHLRRFDRSKSRILSIAWGPPSPRERKQASSGDESDDSDEDENEWTDSWLVAGCSDSSLRKWDITTGRVLDRMSTDKMRGERTLVWAVGVLGDGTIVSGDSLGLVKFWDSRTCTQLHSFQGHNADILCLTISPEGTAIYTSGVDQKTTQFSLIKAPKSGSSILAASSRWVQTSSKRMHSHDVRALAIWPPYTPLPHTYKRQFPTDIAPVLVSGGLDMSLVAAPAALPQYTIGKVVNPLSTSTVATFEDAYHRRIAYSSGTNGSSAVHLARRSRLILCMRETSVTIWRILQKSSNESEELPVPGQDDGWEKVLEMELNVVSNLIASAISGDGNWLAVSDHHETKLFSMEIDEKSGDIKPRRVRDFAETLQLQLPESASTTGASTLTFSPDSSRLVMGTVGSSYILIVDLGLDSGKPRVLRRFDHHRRAMFTVDDRAVKGRKCQKTHDVEMTDAPDAAASSDEDLPDLAKPVVTTITRMAVSPDGQWLATTDDRHRSHIFNLDSVQHHAVLPSFPQQVQALSFSFSAPSLLVLAFANNTFELYDAEARQFPPWSRELCNSLPKRFTHIHDTVLGVAFSPTPSEAKPSLHMPWKSFALFWGATWICKVQLDVPVGWGGFSKKRHRRNSRPAPPQANGRKDGHGHHSENFKVVTNYRQILLAEFLASGELVVVERPLMDILAKLPPAYFKPKYGAS
ncbi:hypothetical protein EVG20_g365 [Dentipellis fragilis]|uniref:Uncharacterized protein n=1 Tax=Dentipellis fragilis TaxID=205917 RepID=A0A4Y9ZFH2_9AGAM|nr:hypothetical protein EVG20_g365 [Dentipellis fragilis]